MIMNKEASLSFKDHKSQPLNSLNAIFDRDSRKVPISSSKQQMNYKSLFKEKNTFVAEFLTDIFDLLIKFHEVMQAIVHKKGGDSLLYSQPFSDSKSLRLIFKYFIFIFTLYGPILIINNSIMNVESISSVLFLVLTIALNLFIDDIAGSNTKSNQTMKLLFFSALNLKFLVCALFNLFGPQKNAVGIIRMFHIQIYFCVLIFVVLRRQSSAYFQLMFFANKFLQIMMLQIFSENRNYFLEHCISISIHFFLLNIKAKDEEEEEEIFPHCIEKKSSFSSQDERSQEEHIEIDDLKSLKQKPKNSSFKKGLEKITFKNEKLIKNSSSALKTSKMHHKDYNSNRNSSDDSLQCEKLNIVKKVSKSGIGLSINNLPSTIPLDSIIKTNNLLSFKNRSSMLANIGLLLFKQTESKNQSISFNEPKFFMYYCNPYLINLVKSLDCKLIDEETNNQIFSSENLIDQIEISNLSFMKKFVIDPKLTKIVLTSTEDKPLNSSLINKCPELSASASLYDLLLSFLSSISLNTIAKASDLTLNYNGIITTYSNNEIIFSCSKRFFKASFTLDLCDSSKYSKSDLISNAFIDSTIMSPSSIWYFVLEEVSPFALALIEMQSKLEHDHKSLVHMIHEFKTPLIMIVTLASNIVSKFSLKEDIMDDIEDISGISNYTQYLITDFLQLSQENMPIQVCRKKIDLKSVLDFCNRIMKSLIKRYYDRKNVLPVLIIDDNLSNFDIISDEGRLKQVLLNFISNSVKFTFRGKIQIICSIKYQRPNCLTRINTTQTFNTANGKDCNPSIFTNVSSKSFLQKTSDENSMSPYVQISIEDEGTGINEEVLSKIKNERFNEICVDRNVNPAGSGIGLSFTNKILKVLGYKMNIYSEKDKGTQVNITINEGILQKSYSCDQSQAKNSIRKSYARSKKVIKTNTLHSIISKKNQALLKKDSRISTSLLNLYKKKSELIKRKNKVDFDTSMSPIDACSSAFRTRFKSGPKKTLNYAALASPKIFTLINPEAIRMKYLNSVSIGKKDINSFDETWSPTAERSYFKHKQIVNTAIKPKSYLRNSMKKLPPPKIEESDDEEKLTERLKDFGDNIDSLNKLLQNRNKKVIAVPSPQNFKLEFTTSGLEIVSKYNTKDYILVVDDNSLLRDTLVNRLQAIIKETQSNIIVKSGSDGVDIISHIITFQSENLLKCVISDEKMNYINGSAAISQLKGISKSLKFPLLICYTAMDETSDLIDSGFNMTISKSISKADLKALLISKKIIFETKNK